MKKFNQDGGFRKDFMKDIDNRDLNSLRGQSLEESNKTFDDTMVLSEEEIQEIKSRYSQNTEEDEMHL